jgi:hypothetical protein
VILPYLEQIPDGSGQSEFLSRRMLDDLENSTRSTLSHLDPEIKRIE